MELQGGEEGGFVLFALLRLHSAPSPSHGEKAPGLANIFSLPSGMVHHPGRVGARAFKQPREAGPEEVQGLGVSCKDQGTPRPWGGQAACRAVRDAGGLPRRKPGGRCTPPLFHTSTCGTRSLQHSSVWDQPTVTHPDQRLALLTALQPELEQSPPLHHVQESIHTWGFFSANTQENQWLLLQGVQEQLRGVSV